MILKEIVQVGVHGINLSLSKDKWQAVLNTVMNLRISWNLVEVLSSCGTVSF